MNKRVALLVTGLGAMSAGWWLFRASPAFEITGPAPILAWIFGAVMVIASAL